MAGKRSGRHKVGSRSAAAGYRAPSGWKKWSEKEQARHAKVPGRYVITGKQLAHPDGEPLVEWTVLWGKQ